MKTKLCTIAVAAVLIVATLFVSCAPSKAVADDTVTVFFGELQAKGIDANIYDTSATPETDFGTGTVNGKAVGDLFWSYKAVKDDGNFTAGQTTAMTGNVNGFMSVKAGSGLDATIEGLSKGDWVFTLQAFTSDADRKAGTPVIYEGASGKVNLTNDKSINAISIAAEYVNPSGNGSATFSITTDITQTATEATSLYSVSKVTVQYDGLDTPVELDAANPTTVGASGSEQTTTTVWSKTVDSIPNGLRTFTYKFYVDDAELKDAGTTATAIVMTNLNTSITGKASITLTAGTVDVKFAGSVDTAQPTIDNSDSSDSSDSTGDTTEATSGVAYNTTSKKYFDTLQKAIDAADAGETVQLQESIDLTEDLTLGKNGITIDLGGKSISGEAVKAKVAFSVASLNGSYYTSLENAVGAAENGDTIVLISNVTVSSPVDYLGDVIIDFNGMELSSSSSCKIIL